jgi:hypothetical protein
MCSGREQFPGPPREMMQGGTILLWSPVDRLRLLSKWRLSGPIQPLVTFINVLFPVQQNVHITYTKQ